MRRFVGSALLVMGLGASAFAQGLDWREWSYGAPPRLDGPGVLRDVPEMETWDGWGGREVPYFDDAEFLALERDNQVLRAENEALRHAVRRGSPERSRDRVIRDNAVLRARVRALEAALSNVRPGDRQIAAADGRSAALPAPVPFGPDVRTLQAELAAMRKRLDARQADVAAARDALAEERDAARTRDAQLRVLREREAARQAAVNGDGADPARQRDEALAALSGARADVERLRRRVRNQQRTISQLRDQLDAVRVVK